MSKGKYTHVVSVNFEFVSDKEEPSKEELLIAAKKKIEKGAVEVEVFDSELNEDEEV